MAQNTLEIIIKANSSKAVSEIKKLDTTIGKISGTSAKGFDAIKAKWTELDNKLSAPGGWKIMLGAAGAAVGVLTTVGVTVKKLADDFMNYAFEVQDFGRIIGATPEEASKLIQVADDVRLSVESMTMAMRSAITKGYAPTVKELGRMSNEYLAIQDPIKRSKYLVDTFGRSGLEMAKLLELGSDKIVEMGNSIEGTSRLMTQEGIQAATDYYKALDKLGESVENVEKAFGAKLVPILTEGANTLADVADSALSSDNVLTNLTQAIFNQKTTVENAALIMGLYVTGVIDGSKANELLRGSVEQVNTVLPDMNERLRSAAEAASGTSEAIDEVGTSAGKSASDLARMAGEAAKIKTIDAKLEFSFPNFADKMQNLIDSVNWSAAGGSALDQFMKGFAANIAGKAPDVQKQIAADVGAVDIALRVETGEITKSEGIQQLMDLAGTDYSKAKSDIETIMKLEPPDIGPYLESIVGLGENTPEAAKQTEELSLKIGATDTAMKLGQASFTTWKDTTYTLGENSREAAAQVGALNTQLKNIPENIDVNINIHTHGGGSVTATGDTDITPGRQSGGPVMPHQWYMVGEKGPELFMPSVAGRIIPNSQITNNNTDKNIYITNNYTIAASKDINIRELARQVAREQQRAGVT